jgi:hypothetical protein
MWTNFFNPWFWLYAVMPADNNQSVDDSEPSDEEEYQDDDEGSE